jgi:hypothetical protein
MRLAIGQLVDNCGTHWATGMFRKTSKLLNMVKSFVPRSAHWFESWGAEDLFWADYRKWFHPCWSSWGCFDLYYTIWKILYKWQFFQGKFIYKWESFQISELQMDPKTNRSMTKPRYLGVYRKSWGDRIAQWLGAYALAGAATRCGRSRFCLRA